jgi:hypothetical protein
VNDVKPVPPDVVAKVADSPAAVPVVFWLNVGQVNVPVLKFPDCGVPRIGVTSVGEFDNTTLPVPVDEVTPVPPFATGKVPVISAVEMSKASHEVFVPSLFKYLPEADV